jgi:hypothetical protein
MFGRLDETIEQGCDDHGEITPDGFSWFGSYMHNEEFTYTDFFNLIGQQLKLGLTSCATDFK